MQFLRYAVKMQQFDFFFSRSFIYLIFEKKIFFLFLRCYMTYLCNFSTKHHDCSLRYSCGPVGVNNASASL